MTLTNEPNQRNEIRKARAERRSLEKLKRVLSKVGDAPAEGQIDCRRRGSPSIWSTAISLSIIDKG
jgi:hypothetical protein